MSHTFSIELSAPRTALFSFLADPRNRPKWQSSIVSLQMLSEGPPGVGTEWREVARGFGRFRMTISAYEEGVLWAESGSSSRAHIELSLHFTEGRKGTTTRLEVSLTLKLLGLLAPARAFAPWILAPLMKADLRRAAALVGE